MSRAEVFPDGGYSTVGNREVTVKGLPAGAVDEGAAGDDQIEHGNSSKTVDFPAV